MVKILQSEKFTIQLSVKYKLVSCGQGVNHYYMSNTQSNGVNISF